LVAGFPRPPDGLAVCLWVAAGEGDPDAVATLSSFGVGGFRVGGGGGGRGQQQGQATTAANAPLPPLPAAPPLPLQQQHQQQQAMVSSLPFEEGGSSAALGAGVITTGLAE